MFLDHFFILRDFCDSGEASPVRSGVITEADVDVRVMFDFVEFVGDVVSDEGECELGVFESYHQGYMYEYEIGSIAVKEDARPAGFMAREWR